MQSAMVPMSDGANVNHVRIGIDELIHSEMLNVVLLKLHKFHARSNTSAPCRAQRHCATSVLSSLSPV